MPRGPVEVGSHQEKTSTAQISTFHVSLSDSLNSSANFISVLAMAIVTYILLRCLYAGLQKRFDPELLGVTASKAFGVIMTDFFVIKLGCYLLAISGPGQVIDIFAYSGYKFEGYVRL